MPTNNTQLTNLIRQFLEYLEIEKGRARNTIENYNFYLNRFLAWSKYTDPSQISQDGVRNYRLWLNRQTDSEVNPLKKIPKIIISLLYAPF
jgi:site-specific recombinase XerD